jgi:hypothetical protein
MVNGERYSMMPFRDKHGERIDKPAQKIAKIGALAKKVDLPRVPDLFDWYEARLRNSFAHSNYQLHNDRYNIAVGPGIVAEGMITHSLSIEKELVPRINGAGRFFNAIYFAWHTARATYHENIVVKGRLAHDESWIDVELTVDETGLIGFRSPPQAESNMTEKDTIASGTSD